MDEEEWQSYEKVAAHLLDRFANHFGVGHFEGKQIVPGESGTEWEIDAKGCHENGESFLVVECKRYTKGGVPQAIAGSLAWTMRETGAAGGILVSPLGLQEGARKVAAHAGIVEVKLREDSTTSEYLMAFLDHMHIGLREEAKLNMTETLQIKLIDREGNVIESREIK